MASRSNSSGQQVRFHRKLIEGYQFFRMRVDGLSAQEAIAHQYIDMVEEYRNTFAKYSIGNKPLGRVLEIGYGARPICLIVMQSMGLDARGIDLDRPILKGTVTEFAQVLRRNGLDRCLKSLVRHTLFDRSERNALAKALRSRGYEYRVDTERFLVGNAAQLDTAGGGFDLIVSEDVFEHIPKIDLEQVVGNMVHLLNPGGVAIVQPCIFTGITGGHFFEWYPHLVDADIERRSKPWDHLRDNAYPANCYLNRLTRSDFRSMLSKHFSIVEETEKYPDLGRQYLTDDVRVELAEYSEHELLSNNVKYVLRAPSINPAFTV
jgi:SAM-dependent methyltransferase